MKPCIRIDKEDRRRSIKLGSNRYSHSKQYYNKMEEELIQAIVVGNRITTYINKPAFNPTDIPIYFDDGFLLEHRYSIANFFFGIRTNHGRIIREPSRKVIIPCV